MVCSAGVPGLWQMVTMLLPPLPGEGGGGAVGPGGGAGDVASGQGPSISP
jgi:hypothetical protein